MDLLSSLDITSRELVRRFFGKVAIFVALAMALSILHTHRLVLMGGLLQTECLVAGAFSVIMATFLRQTFHAATLTYWDEAVAFSGVGMLSHITTTLI